MIRRWVDKTRKTKAADNLSGIQRANNGSLLGLQYCSELLNLSIGLSVFLCVLKMLCLVKRKVLLVLFYFVLLLLYCISCVCLMSDITSHRNILPRGLFFSQWGWFSWLLIRSGNPVQMCYRAHGWTLLVWGVISPHPHHPI